MRPILLVTMALGCATVDSSRIQAEPSAATACALRMCAWGNDGACVDLERSLRRSESITLLMAQVRQSAARSDAFSRAVERCREGDSRRCDDASRALARAAEGAWSNEPLLAALLDVVDREPKGNVDVTALSSR
jgi:hypothetical protein